MRKEQRFRMAAVWMTVRWAASAALLSACRDACDCGAGDRLCDGTDGSGESGTLPFVPTNLDGISLDGITGDLVFDGKACSGAALDTTDGTASCTSDTGYTYQELEQPDGSRIGVFAARNVRLESTETLKLRGTIPTAVVALEDVLIAGTVVAPPGITEATSGGYTSSGPTDDSVDGNGPGGGVAYNDNLGGGGSFCGIGGREGNGVGGGGDPYGTPELAPLVGGSSGAGVAAGHGGGAFQISAGGTLRVAEHGVITMPGGGDKAGGGSGGAILLEASEIIVEGVLAANGGGGDGSGSASPENGQAGDQPAAGGLDPDQPGDGGGAGSAGANIDGADGRCETVPCDFGGSGGGGAGRIRLNSATGDADVGGIVSPALGSGCATQGRVVPAA